MISTRTAPPRIEIEQLPDRQFDTIFSIGRMYRAKVLRQLGYEKYMLRLNQMNFVADSKLKLQTGEIIQVRVSENGQKAVLRIFQEKPARKNASSGKTGKSAAIFINHPETDIVEGRVAYGNGWAKDRQQTLSNLFIVVNTFGQGRANIGIFYRDEELIIELCTNNEQWSRKLSEKADELQRQLEQCCGDRIKFSLEILPLTG